MGEYYFLASLLPQLEIGHVPGLGFVELKELLETNLSREDKEQAKRLLRIVDLENIRSYWAKEPLDTRGNLNGEEIEQALFDLSWPDGVPFSDFFQEFMRRYHTDEERLAHFAQLASRFLQEAGEKEEEGFLRAFFALQREWRLVVVGFRAKRLGKNVDVELQYEDPKEPLVAQILAQKDAKGYEPPFEYRELKPLFESFGESPFDLHKALLEWQFGKVIEIVGDRIFAIDRILGYMARLLLVERWLELDVQKGIEIIDMVEKGVG